MSEKDINKEDLKKVVAGTNLEPEEFDWKTKGYCTPTKPEDPNQTHYEGIANKK